MSIRPLEEKKKAAPRDTNIRLLQSIHARSAKRARDGESPEVSDLQEAMEEAKNAYESMRKVQDELNRAYNDLMHSGSG